MTKECPMCGEPMHLKERMDIRRIPGTSQVSQQRCIEWVCSECDYFEEAEGAEAEGADQH